MRRDDLTYVGRPPERMVSQPIRIPRSAADGLDPGDFQTERAKSALDEARSSLSASNIFGSLDVLWTVAGYRWARNMSEFPLEPDEHLADHWSQVWSMAKSICGTDSRQTVNLVTLALGPCEPHVLPTLPPVLGIGHSWESSSRQVHFELGFWAEMSRQDKLLLSAIELHEIETVVAALFAAFGDAEQLSISPHTAVLASVLRRVCPSRTQRLIRDILVSDGDGAMPTTEDLWAQAITVAAFAGYLMSGSLNLCMHKIDEALQDLPQQQSWAQSQIVSWARAYQNQSHLMVPVSS